MGSRNTGVLISQGIGQGKVPRSFGPVRLVIQHRAPGTLYSHQMARNASSRRDARRRTDPPETAAETDGRGREKAAEPMQFIAVQLSSAQLSSVQFSSVQFTVMLVSLYW